MKAIIDSHIFIGMLGDPAELSNTQLQFVSDPANDLLFLSFASVWEITIKYHLGKLRLPAPPDRIFPAELDDFQVTLLPIDLEHILGLSQLPHHHGDPFDRLILSQAKLSALPIVSSDSKFVAYNIPLIV